MFYWAVVSSKGRNVDTGDEGKAFHALWLVVLIYVVGSYYQDRLNSHSVETGSNLLFLLAEPRLTLTCDLLQQFG